MSNQDSEDQDGRVRGSSAEIAAAWKQLFQACCEMAKIEVLVFYGRVYGTKPNTASRLSKRTSEIDQETRDRIQKERDRLARENYWMPDDDIWSK